MTTVTRQVSAARKRKLRKRGERVWWDQYLCRWVWCMEASKRQRPSRKRGAP